MIRSIKGSQLLYQITILLFFFNCSSHAPSQEKGKASIVIEMDTLYIENLRTQSPIEIHLDQLEHGAPLKFTEIFELIDSVKLTGKGFNQREYIEKIVVDQEIILIVSGGVFGAKEIHKFEKNGKYIGLLEPYNTNDRNGTYQRINDIAFDSQNGIVYVLDNTQYILVKYKIDGYFLGNIDLISGVFPEKVFYSNFLCDAITTDPQGNLLIHYNYYDGNQVPYNYYLYNAKEELITTKKSFRTFEGTTGNPKGIDPGTSSYYYRGLLHVKDHGDTVYCVVQDQFIPKYVFISKSSMEQAVLSKEYRKFPALTYQMMETDDYLLFSYRIFEMERSTKTYMNYYVFFNKNNQKCYLIARANGTQISQHRFFDELLVYRLPQIGPDNACHIFDQNTGVLKKYILK